MNEIESPAQEEIEIKKKQVDWEVPPEVIEAMDEAQLRQFLIETNEKVRRLHEVMVMTLGKRHTTVSMDKWDSVLHPEKQEMYDQMAFEAASNE